MQLRQGARLVSGHGVTERAQQTDARSAGAFRFYLPAVEAQAGLESWAKGYAVDVNVHGRPLNPRLDLWNHSPTGFEWGYGGSGPAQLALALLVDHLGDDEQAVALHQPFKFAVVAKLPKRGWTLSSRDIDQALQSIRSQNAMAGGAL